ncbi:MAG: glycoside hydrolase family 88 protein [Bacteroidota bacterium]
MSNKALFFRLLNTSLLLFFLINTALVAQEIKPAEVKAVMQKVADWQIDHYRDTYNKKKPHHPLDWTNAALYVGMVKWAAMAGDDKYYEWLKRIGAQNDWQLHYRKYHADDHAVGQMYIELYRKYKDEQMIEPTKKQLNFILYHPSQSVLNWQTPFHQDRWNWCDALFMSPPVFAKLYHITGDKKYLDFLMQEYKATTDFLFDKKEHLYYRDERFKTQLDNGTKVFWSRGNGWVFAGLTNIMNELDSDTKEYKYFLKIYKKMAKKLAAIQTPDGHWAMSLLGQEFYPTPETSGSSFFTYGLAWGINQGILDRATYEPVVKKAWNAMVSYVTEDGMLGYVQPIGAAPGQASPDKTEVYGTGAFLAAGSEVYKLYQ